MRRLADLQILDVNVKRENWEQAKDIFNRALSVEPHERAEFLNSACEGDEDLRCGVETLLFSFDESETFLENPAVGEFAELIADEQPELKPGEIVGHYEILDLLGTGGMGEVYLAQDKKLNRRVALKFLPSDALNPNNRRRFQREAQAAAALEHPHICHIYEIAEAGDKTFIAMQYVKGETLAERLKRENLSLFEALEIAAQIADALVEAHSRGIVHRDIKPANVIINSRGDVKVLDFGLAKMQDGETGKRGERETRRRGDEERGRRGDGEKPLTSSKNSASPLLPFSSSPLLDSPAQNATLPGMVMGTAAYMSPEQARGLTVDGRADVWSLGVVLYEMLTEKVPFAGETTSDVIAAILKSEPLPLADFASVAPPELQKIVSKSLAKTSAERYNSVELLAELRSVKRQLEPPFEKAASLDLNISDLAKTKDTDEILLRTTSARYKTAAEKSEHPEFAVERFTPLEKQLQNATALFGGGFWTLLALAVVLLVGFTIWQGGDDALRQPEQPIDSLAIMPFTNEGGDPNAEYFADGITETLINKFSRLENLRVTSRSTAFRYKNKAADVRQIGKELKARTVLTGRILTENDSLTVRVELVDIERDAQLFGETYRVHAAELLTTQERIAAEIVGKLRLRLRNSDELLSRGETRNAEAYRLYLKGRYYWNKRTREGFAKAIEHFNQAIERDPLYALAYAGLADSYMMQGEYAHAEPRDVYPKARLAARKALEIDEQLAEACISLAMILLLYDWDAAQAEAEFKRAIELKPNYATAHQWYGDLLMLSGRFDEAHAEMRRAVELDPLSLIANTALGYSLWHSRRYDEAIDQLQKTLELDSHFLPAISYLAMSYEQKGAYAQSLAAFEKQAEALGTDGAMAVMIGRVHVLSGNKAKAGKSLAKIELQKRDIPAIYLALAYAALKDKEKTFLYLEKAFEERSSWLPHLKTDPRFDDLRGDARFQNLLRRVGF